MKGRFLTLVLLFASVPAAAQEEDTPAASPVTLMRIGFEIAAVTPVRDIPVPGRPGERRLLNGMWLQKGADFRYCEQLPSDGSDWRCGPAR